MGKKGKIKGNGSGPRKSGKEALAMDVDVENVDEGARDQGSMAMANEISQLSLNQEIEAPKTKGEIANLRKELLKSPLSALQIVNDGGNASLLFAALDGLVDNQDVVTVIALLGKLVLSYPSATRFAELYLQKHGSPLKNAHVDGPEYFIDRDEPINKRLRACQSFQFRCGTMNRKLAQDEFVAFLRDVFIVMRVLPFQVYSSWDITKFLKLNNSSEFSDEIRWFSYRCLTLLLLMTEEESLSFSKAWQIDSAKEQSISFQFQRDLEALTNDFKIRLRNDSGVAQGIQHIDTKTKLVSAHGIIVKQKESSTLTFANTVTLPSVAERLKTILLHVANGYPVCVVGPIGSGKTTTIRQVCSIYGRLDYPEVVSVQINDQMDSRVVLGSYHSTDMPGQFVWKPGCLTSAVINGNWIIFEDIDAAPKDVVTLLEGFMDTGTLSVPGYGDIECPHPDFRIFATCRTQDSHFLHAHSRIGKLWKKIFIDNYTREEVREILYTKFSHLRPVAEVLVNLFYSLIDYQKNSKLLGNARSLTVRDFFKMCQRISSEMDFTAAASAISLFQDGLDLFVSAISNIEVRNTTAEIIATHLNLLASKAEYFLTMHTPSIGLSSGMTSYECGRFSLKIANVSKFRRDIGDVYSLTRRSCNTLEAVAGFIKNKEPVLLVGETGVGKTSCIQHLAKILKQKLVVVNLNRQSDSGDLLGGYKPVEMKYIFLPLREEFESLFVETFSRESNVKFLGHIMTCYANKRWKDLSKLLMHVEKSALSRTRKANPGLHERWITFYRKLNRVEAQMQNGESPFAFSFIDGTLIKAVKNGYWILLDEINLATSEMLQCLASVLDEYAQIHLWEKGDDQPIQPHKNFHLFAAMNPSTDVGKKDLPVGIRNRFSELFVSEITDADELRVLVSDYLKDLCLSSAQVNNIVQFYIKIRSLAQTTLVDGLGKRPHYSLRTFCRALKIASLNLFGSVSRSLYESFCLSFLTQLDFNSHPVVQQLVAEHVFVETNIKAIVNQPIPCNSPSEYIQVEGFWIPRGELEKKQPEKYIITSSIRRNLRDIARIVSAGKLPILIQGATSVGKTSLINYLAECSGNRCYRINNHQHTDLQEYIGSYQSDKHGKLVFAEGVLVQAMRKGEWIILDELNLAPSEVLEALNRVLDDNRQLFIPETGVTVTAHPRFMLFATQNPPGLYGGRKILSRAFRNRFVELHFDEIPSAELENILHLRCDIPVSYCKKIIGVLKDLQIRRKASAALQGKHGFATLRDLFRWAERYRLSSSQTTKFYDWDQHLADEGFLVLAGKERKEIESEVIRDVLEKRFKRQVHPNNLFSLHDKTSTVTRDILTSVLGANLPDFKHIVWTYPMRRLAVLIGTAMKFKEPILLVGDTGCGKTTIIQLLSQLMGRKLYCVNCHMNSEGSDFLGGLRPVRNRCQENDRLFEWVDGPLVEAMQGGAIFLADEISLADDSVLERLNSVLEPERTLLIAEKGDEVPEIIVADSNFHFVGTMNPGGDYGKKELSPALRNRLTEIWCEATSNEDDLISIVEYNLVPALKANGIGKLLVEFVKWLKNNDLGQKCVISIRDYLSWINFMNHMIQNETFLSPGETIIHGACLTVLDGLGTGTTGSESPLLAQELRFRSLEVLGNLMTEHTSFKSCDTSISQEAGFKIDSDNISFGPFRCSINSSTQQLNSSFSMDAPTTSINAMRLIRAMQLTKPMLLEGSPGVGKTALVSALAKISGYPLTRINLSEQTDISDLFGADLPVEGKEGGHFEWRDGPLLQALKSNSWILLDELNLASQSVLEGLNACLDHRGSIYVPELNRTFTISNAEGLTNSRIFACQNPVRQGGARKGLPKSFLNRFIQVYVDSLSVNDFEFVLRRTFPTIPESVTKLMSTFAIALQERVCQKCSFGAKGSPWDINLRDLMRWAELTVKYKTLEEFYPQNFVDTIYGLRMRTPEDRRKVLDLFCSAATGIQNFESVTVQNIVSGFRDVIVLGDKVVVGQAKLPRLKSSEFSADKLLVLRRDLAQLEGLILCLNMGWMPILVGPSGSGKTSLVKLTGELCGRKLEVIHPSPEMDTIELLGGFEQADVYRRIYGVQRQVKALLQHIVKGMVLANNMDEEILNLWLSMKSLLNLNPEEGLPHSEEVKRIQVRVDFLQSAYLKCKSFAESESRNLMMLPYENRGNSSADPPGPGMQKLREEEELLFQISKELEQIYTHLKAGIQTGAFQWIDSRLIKAMEKGEWLLIDGANRCSAAVLDRLNSLMEPNGSIILSERGSIDGNILEIKPHPEFRLILTVDPAFGEISRAMRNRGVEIYMGDEPYETASETPETNDSLVGPTLESVVSQIPEGKEDIFLFGVNIFDLDCLLKAEGLRDKSVRNAVLNLHRDLNKISGSLTDTPEGSVFRLLSSSKEIVSQVQQGINFTEACRRSLRNWYMLGNTDVEIKSKIEKAISDMIDTLSSRVELVQFSPLVPLVLQNFVSSECYRVWKHMEVLEFCLQLVQQETSKPGEGKLRLENMEDFMVLSVFSRILKEDVGTLSGALSLRYPLKAGFLNKLTTILKSERFEDYADSESQFWDLQELDAARKSSINEDFGRFLCHLVKSLKTSARMYSQSAGFYHGFVPNPRKGTLGFLLKNLKEAEGLRDFLQAFWALATSYHHTIESALLEEPSLPFEAHYNPESFAQMWQLSLKSYLWGKRISELCQEKCDGGLPDEKLLAKMNLVTSWISEQVVPALEMLMAGNAQQELYSLVEKCFSALGHCRDRILLESNRALRDFSYPCTLTPSKNLKTTEQLMRILGNWWSYENFGLKECQQSFFSSGASVEAHSALRSLSEFLINDCVLTSAQVTSLEQVVEMLSVLESCDFPIERTALNLCAVQELLRIQRKSCTLASGFTNPFLEACRLFGETSKNSILQFLAWEDVERFRHLFVEAPLSHVPSSHLFPIYAARVLIDEAKATYLTPSLKSNNEVGNAQRKLQSILSSQLLDSRHSSKVTVHCVVTDFLAVLQGWINIFANQPLTKSYCEGCFNRFKEVEQELSDESINNNLRMIQIGNLMVEASFSVLEVASSLPAVDPVVEKEISAVYLKEQIELWEDWIRSKQIHRMVLSGRSCVDNLPHPYQKFLKQSVSTDSKELENASSGILPRPTPPMYRTLLTEIQNFTTFCKSTGQTFQKLLQNTGLSSIDERKRLSEILQTSENWLLIHRDFVRKISKHFLYWDITAPFLHTSIQAATGHQLICDGIRRELASGKETNVLSLIKYLTPMDYCRVSTAGVYKEAWAYKKANKVVLISSLKAFLNKLRIQKRVGEKDVSVLLSLCEEFVSWWKVQEDEKRRQKEEEDAFYVYKGKERQMERTEDEQEKVDISNTFPTFETDFTDLREVRTLDDPIADANSNAFTATACDDLKFEDIDVLLGLIDYATSFVAAPWLQSKSFEIDTEIDVATPFVEKFETGCFALVDGSLTHNLTDEEETEFVVGSVVAGHLLQRQSQMSKWDPTTYNFYYDSNVSEAQKLQSLFAGMKIRVNELLEEWPDHPALEQIIKIVNRIESFPISSPIMRFVTGLELLLGTCQEWEGVACKRVSISIHLEELTNLIISWRKLELRFWKNLLEHTFKKYQSEARSWWFHLFSVVMELVSQEEQTNSGQTFLEVLRKFMESSTLGEFGTRLDLLKIMHRYVALLKNTKVMKSHSFIQACLWNTISYYNMFRDEMAIKLNSLRKPIEQKLKDFMKISRWNDSNFFALVDSVKKSQKTLNKLIVDFKKVLKTPVSSFLVINVDTEDNKKLKFKVPNVSSNAYIVPEKEMQLGGVDEGHLLLFGNNVKSRKRFAKLPKIKISARQIALESLQNHEEFCQSEGKEIGELSGTIVEKVISLQNQYIPGNGPERKKALHNVHNIRRKNLANLFKILQGLGISYKKGIVQIQNFTKDRRLPYDFLMSPIGAAGWSTFTPSKTKKATFETAILSVWDSCENYFQKSLARTSALLQAFQNPSKELGSMIAERCKGFSVELLTMTVAQRADIGKVNSALWELRILADSDSCTRINVLAEPLLQDLHNMISSLDYVLRKLKVLVESLSEDAAGKTLLLTEISAFSTKMSSVKSSIHNFVNSLSLPFKVVRNVHVDDLEEAKKHATEMLKSVNSMLTVLRPNCILSDKITEFSSCAQECHLKIVTIINLFQNLDVSGRGEGTAGIPSKFGSAAKKALETMLLAFQNLKHYQQSSTESGISCSNSFALLKSMDIPTLQASMFSMRSILSKRIAKNGNDVSAAVSVYEALRPLLKQFILTAEFYLKASFEYHRECCKLLYILTGLFATLAQKGFCLPSDYEDEAAEEGPELDAKSGMGLGDGEMTDDAKDVSDRLESEDQLDDTMKAGESLAPADKDLKDDDQGIEMSEDFDGKQQDKKQSTENKDDDDDDKSSSGDEDEDFDKQMGDIDAENEDVLDDQMWGGSSDEEEEEEDQKDSSEGKGVPQSAEPELAPKDSEKETKESDPNESNTREEPRKEFNENDDGEVNDDQVDPYHGENAPEEEPDAMDLPDDLQLDGEGEDNAEGDQDEPNPFDLDNKEMDDFQDVETKEDEVGQEDGEQEISDKGEDDAEGMDIDTPQVDKPVENELPADEPSKNIQDIEDIEQDEKTDEEEKVEEKDEPVTDNSKEQSTEDAVEQAPEKDKANASTASKDLSAPKEPDSTSIMDAVEEQQKQHDDSKEPSGGQVNSEDGSGQEGQTVNKENANKTKGQDEDPVTRKPGETDNERSISSDIAKSRLKTVKESLQEDEKMSVDNDESSKKEADLYQHIKEATKHDALTIDNATSEQMDQMKNDKPKEDSETLPDSMQEDEKEHEDHSDAESLSEVKVDSNPPDLIKGLPQDKRRKKKREEIEEDESPEDVEIPGERAVTHGAQRPADSTYHTQIQLLEGKSVAVMEVEHSGDVLTKIETSFGEVPLMREWHELERMTIPLSQDLCEQLRLILEPTQASKLKGDYKTGKRLNMRKVIPYIASGFRKDKIWLRRTDPSKREYQILLALDDSASMSDNQSKQMAFSAVAVVAKALSLLEVGQLGVASFGEDVQYLHSFDESFTDFSGARLMQKFTFAQRKTRIVQLMETTTALFKHARQTFGNSSAPVETAQLLLIISDGRAVSHEGNEVVKNAVKKAMEQNVFTVFIIVDNPANQHSILDVQKPIFQEGKPVRFIKYMDEFPFPFYLILRDLAALPSVLSDALRQWFELVTSSSR